MGKRFDMDKYIEVEEDKAGIHALDAPCIWRADGESIGVDGSVYRLHAIAFARHFKLTSDDLKG